MTGGTVPDRLIGMTDALPRWALSDGRPDAEKIIKYLYRYGYVKDVDGETFIDQKLNEDYPEVFQLLYNYQMSSMVDKYTEMIDQGKFHAYRDDDDNLKYRMDDDVE